MIFTIEDKLTLKAAMETLELRERVIIYGYYWEGRTDAEIAERLDVSQQSVNSSRRAAEKKLQAELVKPASKTVLSYAGGIERSTQDLTDRLAATTNP
jgi:DNA-directed RNA polymerase specialized sigma24 family protein